jgi:hypothetical protein
MARKTTEIVTLSLRIREELRKRIEREAKRADRSMNAEIVHRLELSFQQGDMLAWLEDWASDQIAKRLPSSEEQTSLAELGFTREERLARAAQRRAGIDPDKPKGEDSK